MCVDISGIEPSRNPANDGIYCRHCSLNPGNDGKYPDRYRFASVGLMYPAGGSVDGEPVAGLHKGNEYAIVLYLF